MKNNLNYLQEMNDILINEKGIHLEEIKKLKLINENYRLESDDEKLDDKKEKELLGKLVN